MLTKFFKDTGFSLVSQVCSLVFGLGTIIILARVLGPDNRGLLAVVMLLPHTIFALLASGFAVTVVRSIASEEWEEKEIIPNVLGLAIYLTTAVLVAAGIAMIFRETLLPSASVGMLCVAALILPLTILQSCYNSVLVGLRTFDLQMKASFVSAPLGFVLTLVFVLALGLGVWGALTAQVLAVVINLGMTIRAVKKAIPSHAVFQSPNVQFSHLSEAAKFGGKAHLANVTQFLNYRVDQFIVNILLGTTAVGIYTVAVQNAERLWLLVSNTAAVVFPAAAGENSDHARFANFTAELAATVLLVLAGAGAILILISKPLIIFLFSSDFEAAAGIICWLVPGIVLMGHTKIIGNYVSGRGYPGRNAITAMVGLAVNICANILLIPRFGLQGAAMATSLSYGIQSLIAYGVFVHLSKVSILKPIIPPMGRIMEMVGRLSQRIRSKAA